MHLVQGLWKRRVRLLSIKLEHRSCQSHKQVEETIIQRLKVPFTKGISVSYFLEHNTGRFTVIPECEVDPQVPLPHEVCVSCL